MQYQIIILGFYALMVCGCKDSANPNLNKNQNIVHFGWSIIEPNKSKSNERELLFRLDAENPQAELILRFEFPEPKSLLSFHSTQEETIIVLEDDSGVYRLDHKDLLSQKDHYSENNLLSLDAYKK